MIKLYAGIADWNFVCINIRGLVYIVKRGHILKYLCSLNLKNYMWFLCIKYLRYWFLIEERYLISGKKGYWLLILFQFSLLLYPSSYHSAARISKMAMKVSGGCGSGLWRSDDCRWRPLTNRWWYIMARHQSPRPKSLQRYNEKGKGVWGL